ncbi:hypothetical protein EYF80_055246 [Liparis tanakae]|uniref:Uncharacterized protein n=1 Tax=Liparis tanakae TaxID=230148 RepID=A0A4Z2F1P8_9TELE|nr:hypothetical protein EYF80_055246 [Liparis tanakae]
MTGKMCQGVVPACQQTSCSPSQNPEGNCSGPCEGSKAAREYENTGFIVDNKSRWLGATKGRTDRRGGFDGFDRSLEDFARQAQASPRMPSQLDPLMKKRSDWVMAAMLERSVALGPWDTDTRSVPSSPSQRPWV